MHRVSGAFTLFGAPDKSRTCGLELRKFLLYPTELRERGVQNILSLPYRYGSVGFRIFYLCPIRFWAGGRLNSRAKIQTLYILQYTSC